MAKKNNTGEEELEKLVKELFAAEREKYECVSKILQNLVELSKNINEDMKDLHENLSDITWAFDDLFSEEETTAAIYDVMSQEEIKKMLDSASSIVDQTEVMMGYTSSISEDINKILHIGEEPRN